MTIVLDLDDVLANLRESLYRTLSVATGIDLHWRNWTHYDLRQHYAIDEVRLNEVLITKQALEACEPEHNAATTTHELVDLGFDIVIVTARGWHPQAESITRSWLAAHAIRYDHLAVVPLQGNKLDAIDTYSNIWFAVDDHPSHVLRYQAAGIPTLVMDRPWNVGCSGHRVFSTAAVVEYAHQLRERCDCKPTNLARLHSNE